MFIALAHSTYDNCEIKFKHYPNNRPALIIYLNNQRILTASVNLPNHNIPDNYIAIKDWSENSGILASLIANKIIDHPEYLIPCGYVEAAICKILINIED